MHGATLIDQSMGRPWSTAKALNKKRRTGRTKTSQKTHMTSASRCPTCLCIHVDLKSSVGFQHVVVSVQSGPLSTELKQQIQPLKHYFVCENMHCLNINAPAATTTKLRTVCLPKDVCIVHGNFCLKFYFLRPYVFEIQVELQC